ncbi:MAG: TRAP transporter substrate-binding protein DctP [Chloroflexi bacterium]|nr:TRAP transporter substrate-binding protein DctP [Chloroflexota bacterium]
MKRNRLLTLSVGICLLVALLALPFVAACAQPAPEAGPIILKALTYAPWDRDVFWGYREFIKRFNEQAKGEAFIQYIGGAEVVSGWDQAEAVMKGAIDMTNVYGAPFTKFTPVGQILAFSRLSPMEERKSGFYDAVVKTFEGIGVRFVGRNVTNLPFYAYTNFKPQRYQDLAGKKMSQIGLYREALKKWGAIGVDVEDAELYTSYQQGLVDGGTDLPSSILDYGLYEVLKYIVDYPVAGANSIVTWVNLNAWNRLPKDMQDLMLEIQVEMEPEIASHFTDFNAQVIQTLVDKGMERISFSTENGKEYIETFYDANWDAFETKFSPEEYRKWREMSGM